MFTTRLTILMLH